MSNTVDTTPSTSRLEVIRKLGRGGMADVYLCRMGGVGGFEKKLVAKVVRPEHAQDAVFSRMFLDEARLSARLQHPNLIHVYGIEQTEGRLVLMMEYVDGPSLNSLLRRAHRAGDVPALHVAALLAGVARGLGYAHRLVGSDGAPLELIHRDVSLDNILVSMEGTPKLIDFGIARATDRVGQTMVGTVKGKLQYMAPEQLDGQEIDHRADIYALGVCLYMALTGARPFPAVGQREVWRLRMIGDVVPLGERRTDLPLELVELVEHAMAADPDQRFSSADLLADELEALALSGPRPSRRAERLAWIAHHAPSPEDPPVADAGSFAHSLSGVLRGVMDDASATPNPSGPVQPSASPTALLGQTVKRNASWHRQAMVAGTVALAMFGLVVGWMLSNRIDGDPTTGSPESPAPWAQTVPSSRPIQAPAASPEPTPVAPVVDAPAVDAPAVDAPAVDAPAVDAPAVDAPAAAPLAIPAAKPVAKPVAKRLAADEDPVNAIVVSTPPPQAPPETAPVVVTVVERAPAAQSPPEPTPAPPPAPAVRASDGLPVSLVMRTASEIEVAFESVARAVIADGGDASLASKAARTARTQILRDFYPGSTIVLRPRALAQYLLSASAAGTSPGAALADVRRGLRDGRFGENQ